MQKKATHVKLEAVDIQAIALLFTALHLGYVVTEVQCSYRIFCIVQLYVGSLKSEDEEFSLSDDKDKNIELLQKIKDIIIVSNTYALKSLKYSNSFLKIYNRLKHSLNQQMIDLILNNPTTAKRDLADMIYQFKKDIIYSK